MQTYDQYQIFEKFLPFIKEKSILLIKDPICNEITYYGDLKIVNFLFLNHIINRENQCLNQCDILAKENQSFLWQFLMIE